MRVDDNNYIPILSAIALPKKMVLCLGNIFEFSMSNVSMWRASVSGEISSTCMLGVDIVGFYCDNWTSCSS